MILLVTICNGKIDLSLIQSMCPVTSDELYDCLRDSYHSIILNSNRYISCIGFGERFLQDTQTVIIGGFDSLPAVSVCKGSTTCCPLYDTNHLEADTALWYHAMQVDASKVIIYSPDNYISSTMPVTNDSLGVTNDFHSSPRSMK